MKSCSAPGPDTTHWSEKLTALLECWIDSRMNRFQERRENDWLKVSLDHEGIPDRDNCINWSELEVAVEVPNTNWLNAALEGVITSRLFLGKMKRSCQRFCDVNGDRQKNKQRRFRTINSGRCPELLKHWPGEQMRREGSRVVLLREKRHGSPHKPQSDRHDNDNLPQGAREGGERKVTLDIWIEEYIIRRQ